MKMKTLFSTYVFKKLCERLWGLVNPGDWIQYHRDYKEFKKTNKIPVIGKWNLVGDRHGFAGTVQQYFLQDLYIAKKIGEVRPTQHYDIGSRLDGFIAHLLAMGIPVTMLDIRPLNTYIDGLTFRRANATDLSNIEENSIESLSSLHAAEHFGLGRYGDPIDPDGWLHAIQGIQRIVCKGGVVYFSVPVRKHDGVIFDAHRIFSPKTILNAFSEMDLLEFSLIKEGSIYTYHGEDAKQRILNHQIDTKDYDNPLFQYDVGMFILKK